jgi:hypothetical protein
MGREVVSEFALPPAERAHLSKYCILTRSKITEEIELLSGCTIKSARRWIYSANETIRI